jgi:integrase/recombinase XerD
LLSGIATAATSQPGCPWLSTYLGHVATANTYWYLQAAPELMAEAARRLDTHLGQT